MRTNDLWVWSVGGLPGDPVKGLGQALIFAGGPIFAIFLGGYLQSFMRKPWAEPVKWINLTAEQRERELAKFRERNARWRPKFAFVTFVSLALAVAGIILVAAA